MFTIKDIQNTVALIEKIKGDAESAHSAQDNLYFEVLSSIAEGAENAAELAAEALKVEEIDFARWCA